MNVPYWAVMVAGVYQDKEPPDLANALKAAVELAKQGLTARDISEALGLSEIAVRALLERMR